MLQKLYFIRVKEEYLKGDKKSKRIEREEKKNADNPYERRLSRYEMQKTSKKKGRSFLTKRGKVPKLPQPQKKTRIINTMRNH